MAEAPETDPMYAAAEALATRGFPVFPVGPSRVPFAGSRGFYDASVNREKVAAMWRAHPHANIAIRTGQISAEIALLVVDIDPRNDGPVNWTRIVAGRPLPESLRVNTGRDGTHIYFFAPLDKDYPKDLAHGVDIKCVGGYVVAPPSSHEAGHEYTWENWGTDIAHAPEWLLTEIRERKKEVRRYESQFKDKIPEAIIQGGRDIALTSMAGKMRRGGFVAAEILAALTAANSMRCKPPLDDRQVTKIATSVSRYEPAEDILAKNPDGLEFLTAEQMTADLGPIPWVCEPLRLAPGFPTMIAGYGFAGKTVACQQILLALAAGGLVLESFPSAPARVVHIDWDQGPRTTIERYQRICFAAGWNLSELVCSGRLSVSSLPESYLTDKKTINLLCTILEGVSVCLIDSMTSALPGVDENSRDVAEYLYALGRVSAKTGCAILVLHHYRKSSPSVKDEDPAQLIRGNGAIYNALSTAYGISGKKGEGALWRCVKERHTGREPEPFWVRVEDVGLANAGKPPPGLRVMLGSLSPDELARRRVERELKREIDLDRNILAAIRSAKGRVKTKTALHKIVGGRKEDVFERIDALMDTGSLLIFNEAFAVGQYAQTQDRSDEKAP
jgi:putative DNA primase/helicase